MLPITRILFATDGSSLCRAFAPQVFALAGRLGASVSLLPAGDGIAGELRARRFDLLALPLPSRRPWFGLAPAPAAALLRETSAAVWTATGPAAIVPLRIERILCAVSFDHHTPRLLDTAAALAHTFHAALTVLHVLPPVEEAALPFSAATARERLAAQLRRRALAAAVAIEPGDPAAAISRHARRLPAGLIVIGPGHTGLHRMEILRGAPCPVLILDRPTPAALHCPP